MASDVECAGGLSTRLYHRDDLWRRQKKKEIQEETIQKETQKRRKKNQKNQKNQKKKNQKKKNQKNQKKKEIKNTLKYLSI